MDLKTYFLLFIIYSIIGWTLEVISSFFQKRRFVNRGFLIGPYCPIYGFGGIFLLIFLEKYIHDPLILFFMSIFIFSVLEYFTSYLMEKMFKTRWWDYKKFKFNINGRICLEMMAVFGALGLFAMYFVNPFIIGILNSMNENLKLILSIVIFILFLIDTITSYKIISNFKKIVKFSLKDNTEEITKIVKEVLLNKTLFYRRLVDAFPFFKLSFMGKKSDKNRRN